jgi:hypothetical protein
LPFLPFLLLQHYCSTTSVFCSSKELINYDNVRVTFGELGRSLSRSNKKSVHIHVINAFCRKLFKDKHPKDSHKHYFFSPIGVCAPNYPLFASPFCQRYLINIMFFYTGLSHEPWRQTILHVWEMWEVLQACQWKFQFCRIRLCKQLIYYKQFYS